MPDIKEVRVLANSPAEDDHLEIPFIDELLQEGSPLDRPYLHLDADLSEPLLNYLGGLEPFRIPLVGQYGELERLAVLDQNTVAVLILPPGLGQKLLRPFRIIIKILDMWITGPCARFVRAVGNLPHPELD